MLLKEVARAGPRWLFPTQASKAQLPSQPQENTDEEGSQRGPLADSSGAHYPSSRLHPQSYKCLGLKRPCGSQNCLAELMTNWSLVFNNPVEAKVRPRLAYTPFHPTDTGW